MTLFALTRDPSTVIRKRVRAILSAKTPCKAPNEYNLAVLLQQAADMSAAPQSGQ